MDITYENFVEALTHDARLPEILNILINSMVHYVEDPIAHVTMKFLKEKITIVFLHQGVSLFKSDPTIIMPFKKLQGNELDMLKQLLSQAADQNKIFMCEQRGGSCSITIVKPAHTLITVRPSKILRAIRQLLLPLNKQFKVDVVNVVLQRLVCSAKIPPLEIEASRKESEQIMKTQ